MSNADKLWRHILLNSHLLVLFSHSFSEYFLHHVDSQYNLDVNDQIVHQYGCGDPHLYIIRMQAFPVTFISM